MPYSPYLFLPLPTMQSLTSTGMMDQLASIGVEFDEKALQRLFGKQVRHYESLAPPKKKISFAIDQVDLPNRPLRPWALGAINRATNPLYVLAGKKARTPGLYKQIKGEKPQFLVSTNEKIHSSVRVRLKCKGLGLDDCAVWEAEALKKWKLVRKGGPSSSASGNGNLSSNSSSVNGNGKASEVQTWGPPLEEQEDVGEAGRWEWVYVGPERKAPPVRRMEEERLGPYERYWLKLAGGAPNAYHFADACEHD